MSPRGDSLKRMTKEKRTEVCKLGGNSHNKEHFRKIGAIGGKAILEKRGKAYFSEIGKIGGEATRKYWEAKREAKNAKSSD